MAKYYFYEDVKYTTVFILTKKSEDMPTDDMLSKCAHDMVVVMENYGPLQTVSEENVLAHQNEWELIDDDWTDPYYIWSLPIKPKEEEPKEDKSCGTSLASLLKKSGF